MVEQAVFEIAGRVLLPRAQMIQVSLRMLTALFLGEALEEREQEVP